MKLLFSLLLALVALRGNLKASDPIKFRSDVLYFQNNAGGRKASQEIAALYDSKQAVILVDGELPKVAMPVPLFLTEPIYPAELKNSTWRDQSWSI